MSFKNAMIQNRDENSFTARLFEGYLFPKWRGDSQSFLDFLTTLVAASAVHARLFKDDRGGWPQELSKLKFKHGGLFVENVDLSRYFGRGFIDRTEFDVMILCEDDAKMEQVLVFEVKCYDDMNQSEILRQHDRLGEYGVKYHHFGLVSYDNIEYGSSWKGMVKPFYLISWDDLYPQFMPEQLFPKESLCLPKHVPKNFKPGQILSMRHLVSPQKLKEQKP